MPELTAEEFEALRSDIAERGLVVPVVRDQHGRLLDGHHRERIATDCPTETRIVADDAQAREVALALNLARRHLTREQRRDLIAREIELRPGDSDRASRSTRTGGRWGVQVGHRRHPVGRRRLCSCCSRTSTRHRDRINAYPEEIDGVPARSAMRSSYQPLLPELEDLADEIDFDSGGAS